MILPWVRLTDHLQFKEILLPEKQMYLFFVQNEYVPKELCIEQLRKNLCTSQEALVPSL